VAASGSIFAASTDVVRRDIGGNSAPAVSHFAHPQTVAAMDCSAGLVLPVQGPRSAISEAAHVGGVSPGGQHRPVRMLRADPTIKLIVYPRMGLVGPNGSQTSTNR